MTILFAFAVFLTAFVLVLAFVRSESSVRTRLDALTGQSTQQGQPGGPAMSSRIFGPASVVIVSAMRRLLPTKMLDGLQHRLVLAGDPMTVNGFLIFQALTTASFVGLPGLVIMATGVGMSLMVLGVVLFFVAVGFMLPNMWLRQRAGQRQAEIIKMLPDSFDLITTCVEAGLALDAALARVSEKVEGPFSDELRRMLHDIALGKLRKEALLELAERTDVQDLSMFVNAVIQAEEMGSSVGVVLRVQSEQMRTRRRQRAEEQAYKAPVKMLFPMVLCIFPTLFIVILGPAVITIMTEFPGQ
ncbi:MAG: type II secretion system F family protein [Anaerolineales bacterium]|nr:type II secretion system F family protein [Anaerolineales bacterium]